VNHTCKETHNLKQKHKNKNNIRNASLQGGNTHHWFFTYITVLIFMALALFQVMYLLVSYDQFIVTVTPFKLKLSEYGHLFNMLYVYIWSSNLNENCMSPIM